MESAWQSDVDAGRRHALKAIAAGAVAATLGTRVFGSGTTPAAAGPRRAEPGKTASGPYNILFILTDQERYFRPG